MSRSLVLALLILALAVPAAHADLAELITVTPEGAAITWTTAVPGDSTICLDDRPCEAQEQGVRYHRAEVRGLAPGSAHAYAVQTNGAAEPSGFANPGRFTTLTPPPGRHLFRFAVMNDLHVGEGCAGTLFNEPLAATSVPPCFSAPDYAARMNAGQIAEIGAQGIDVTLINGDVTAEAEPEETAAAKALLDKLPGTVLVARGNHDRVHGGRDCAADSDCFRETFYPGRPSGRIYASVSRHGYRFIALDSVKGSSQGDLTDADQNAWLQRELAAHPRQPTFITFHHPASVYADAFQAEPVIFGVPPYAGGTEFLDLVADNPQIVGVMQAHTHRNLNSYGRNANTVFVENGTSKEYPGGYSVFDVYEGGFTRSYVRPRDCAFCREWTQTTSAEFFGLAPLYLLGSVGTRNFTHVYGCDAELPPTSLPGTESLVTGGVVTPPARCLDRVRPAGVLEPDEGGGLNASFALTRRTARLRRTSRSGLLSLRCERTAACTVSGGVVTTVRGKTLALARARGTVRGGRTGRVRLTLSARGRRAVRAHRRVRARARLIVRVAPGDERRLAGRVTFARG